MLARSIRIFLAVIHLLRVGERVRGISAQAGWQNAVDWLEDARSLKRKEGRGALPVSATEPILTMAEKRVLREEKVDRITLGELCDELKGYIKKHPTQYKDQVNPPQRLDRIKTDLGDRPAASIWPKDIEEWLDGLTNLHAQRGASQWRTRPITGIASL